MEKRLNVFGIFSIFGLVCSGIARASWHIMANDVLLAAAMEENDTLSIIARCRSKNCTSNDLSSALRWAIIHGDDADGASVAKVIVSNININVDSINHNIVIAIEAGKHEIVKILVKSPKASASRLQDAQMWAIDCVEGEAALQLVQIITGNRNLPFLSARMGLVRATMANRPDIIMLLTAISKIDKGGLLAALSWAIEHAESEHGSVIAQIVVDNPIVEAKSISHSIYRTIEQSSGNILKILVASNKATVGNLDEALLWAIEREENAEALQIAQIIVANENVHPQSILDGIHYALKNDSWRIIKILAASRHASNYSLKEALFYVINHKSREDGEVAHAISRNPNMRIESIMAGLYLAISNNKHSIVRALVNGGRLGCVELDSALMHIIESKEDHCDYAAQILIESPNLQRYSLVTGLYKSMDCSKSEMVKLLVNSGRLETAGLLNALSWAETMHFDDIVLLCLSNLRTL